MKLPDSCVWIELFIDTPTGRRYRPLFARPQELLVPTLVLFELRRWALRELGEASADHILAGARGGVVVDLDEPTATYAAQLARLHGLAALDALIYATARRAGTTLVSCDAHFEGLPQVDYAPKLAARP